MIEKTLYDLPHASLFYGIFPTESHETFLYVSGETRRETIIKSRRAGFDVNNADDFVVFNDNEFYSFSKTHQMLRVTVYDTPTYHQPGAGVNRDGITWDLDEPELSYDVEKIKKPSTSKTIRRVDKLMGRLSESMSVKTPVYHERK